MPWPRLGATRMAPRRSAVALLATSACTAFVLHRAVPRAACHRAAESEEESKRSKAKKLWDKLRGKDETDQRPPTRDAARKSHVVTASILSSTHRLDEGENLSLIHI